MKVSEVLALRIENIALKLTVLQAQAGPLVKERDRLIEEARKESNVPDGWLYNTDTGEFVEPK